jgi:hypothetical protein
VVVLDPVDVGTVTDVGAVAGGRVVVVEVGGAVVVDDVPLTVVVSCAFSTTPGNELGLWKVPTFTPLVHCCMNCRQMVAGNEPPVTAFPCTLFMSFGTSFPLGPGTGS